MRKVVDGAATNRDYKVAAAEGTSYYFDGVVGGLRVLRKTHRCGSNLFGNDFCGFGRIFNWGHSTLLGKV